MYNLLNSMYNYSGSSSRTLTEAEVRALLELFKAVPSWLIIAILLTFLLLGVICTIAYWKIFEKAGEDGWKILIPLYNSYIIAKIVYGNGWKFLFSIIPIIQYIFPIMLMIRMAQAYGKNMGFALLNLFVPEIGLMLLGFGKCDYEGPIYSFM